MVGADPALASDDRRAAVRAVSLPNVLTYLRILAVPAIVACLFLAPATGARWWALAVFIAACITDWLDGYLARVWQQQSALGRMLDPIADKLLVGATLLMLTARQHHRRLVACGRRVIILCREILVSGLREFLAELNVQVHVTQLAKWKTTMQMVALGVLLAGRAGDKIRAGHHAGPGSSLLWIAALLTLWTGYDYLKAPFRHGDEGRVQSHARKLLYFAWVREKTGKPPRRLDLPAEVATVAELVAWLKARGPEYAEAFARADVIRAAIDQHAMSSHAPAIAGAREIAFFPPVTGG